MPDPATTLSTIPLLFAVQMLAVFVATRHAVTHKGMTGAVWIYALMCVLVAWGGVTTALALLGVYQTDSFLAAYPTLWLPFVPATLILIIPLLFTSARTAVRDLIDASSWKWLIGIHALRILAVGTLIKAWRGEFARSFAILVGIPDMLFGLSAVFMLWLAKKGRVSAVGLILWNLLGVAVILPAPIVGQRGLPGLFNAVEESPGMVTLYEFPMVLAPTLVVPVFFMTNLFVAIRLVERSASEQTSGTRQCRPKDTATPG